MRLLLQSPAVVRGRIARTVGSFASGQAASGIEPASTVIRCPSGTNPCLCSNGLLACCESGCSIDSSTGSCTCDMIESK